MATTPAAVASVKSAVSSVSPSSSPFAELLRRSRFASFDPQIRQTYYSPPAYAHRGNWGLKRPLALRRRNAFITMPKPFDDRAQYAEWDNAENEVRFIRRFEEMEVRPIIRRQTPWHRYLGTKNSNGWLLDSEFCERHEGPEAEEQANVAVKQAAEEAKEKTSEHINTHTTPDLRAYGQSGEGNYGHRGSAIQANQVALSPNLNAMSPRQFQRYLKRLRELRPKFKEFLQRNPEWANKTTFQLSQGSVETHFRRFLEENTAESFADVTSGDIEQRPHPVGGLLYTHPSALHSQLFSRPQPGIVLGETSKRDNFGTRSDLSYVASFAGMAPVIRPEDWHGKRPLLNHGTEEGIKRENLVNSVATMRLKPHSVYVVQPPRSVGTIVRGLMGTKIESEAVVDTGRAGFDQTNPYRPGTMEYSGMKGPTAKGFVEADPVPTFKQRFHIHEGKSGRKNSKHVIDSLQNLFL
ncbi:hypothetical protein D9758_000941 [Tetrapyrgos nigripes]|uniref:Uncharacterized protein n=1 Tax=Tetrapyrgos nigripes TaxID=182062 RepID=A0A8H5LY27_9AGAR|nr:hypothetical protein D9758_000941 [Tetrapyrgos nigripes]